MGKSRKMASLNDGVDKGKNPSSSSSSSLGILMERKGKASTLSRRKRQNEISCAERDSVSALVEGRSSSENAVPPPPRFITYILPDDLPTDEEIRQRTPNECLAAFYMIKRNTEVFVRAQIEILTKLKSMLQNKNGQAPKLRMIDIMINILKEVNVAASKIPWFEPEIDIDIMMNNLQEVNVMIHNFKVIASKDPWLEPEIGGESRSGDPEIQPVNEVKRVAAYCSGKMGKQVTETSIVVAKKKKK